MGEATVLSGVWDNRPVAGEKLWSELWQGFCPEGVPLIRSEAKVEAWALRGATKAVMFLGHPYPVQCFY